MFLCSAAFIVVIIELFDQEREICNVCVVQQYYSLQIGVCLQEKETLVSFYVQQHQFLKFDLFLRRKGLALLPVHISIIA